MHGVVVRDENGCVKLVCLRRVRARWPAPLAEVAAALWGLQCAKRHGFEAVELKVDALNLSKAIIARKTGRSPLDLVVDDICLLGDNFFSFDVFMLEDVGILLPIWLRDFLPLWAWNNSLLMIFRKVF